MTVVEVRALKALYRNHPNATATLRGLPPDTDADTDTGTADSDTATDRHRMSRAVLFIAVGFVAVAGLMLYVNHDRNRTIARATTVISSGMARPSEWSVSLGRGKLSS